MKYVDPKLGREKAHTITCYDYVWYKYISIKRKRHLTANNTLDLLTNSYLQSTAKNQKEFLTGLINDLQERLKKL